MVQAVVRAGTMASVVRAASWLELHMDEVVTSSPGVFTALSVVERLVAALPRLRELGGANCIPFMQLALSLAADLDQTDGRDRAALLSLLDRLVVELGVGLAEWLRKWKAK